MRVKAKITIKNSGCRSIRRQHTVFLAVILALTLKSGVALTDSKCRSAPTEPPDNDRWPRTSRYRGETGSDTKALNIRHKCIRSTAAMCPMSLGFGLRTKDAHHLSVRLSKREQPHSGGLSKVKNHNRFLRVLRPLRTANWTGNLTMTRTHEWGYPQMFTPKTKGSSAGTTYFGRIQHAHPGQT